ncbi:ATP-binding protein [Myxococcus sp. CA051A]|uniref:Anti-sigma regulatory factor n=2 Tax=Myxococcus TaxID=32 RepID=A0A540X2C9_9BACT|nr:MULTISPECIES: ATP-binding protein [Myxococcus]NTX53769.1 ATP-binding protein [Myxococcus sp. CA039A]NTX61902.1 ATP-binding protein [Myxococcus sp. CA051A]TQF15421.1 anti-sigma regulatory factor [Myxococcus llanfairpwllgwyngyllgogerychwyrndrobwllllantysiliogogogochensis]
MTETAARLVLRGTLEPLRLSADTLGAAELPRVIEALEPATRHFVDPARRPDLAARLRALTATATVPSGLSAAREPTPAPAMTTMDARPTTYLVRTEADASHARLAARALCESMGGRGYECQKVATAVSELARNQISYAGGGTIQLIPVQTPRKLLRVRAEDQGRGIPELERVLSGTYRSKTGMGLGILGVKRLADRFEVKTGATGTQVEFEVWL